ncbi:MAG: endonuclease Q family protein, partial [Candidatus Aenigmatarchaeota archaeon]
MQIADLHIHSKYSRATSQKMVIEEIANGARIKGIDIVGTGDWTHPLWLKELKAKLTDNGNGLYSYGNTIFLLTTELSLVYTKNKKGRRIHHIILAPNFAVVDQINEFLDKKGRRDYDGRPIFGFDSVELVEAMMQISRDIEIIPAHAWTSWFGIFGSMSGFDSIEECFDDKSKFIHAIETG